MNIVASIQYEKLNQIGVGQGMNSEVFRAFDPQLGGEIAVKEVPKATFGNQVSAFFEEAQAVFASAHANVVPVQYACETQTHVCLAMPYFDRGSLQQRTAGGPLALKESLRVGQWVLNGLARIHLKGYLHLDLKPSNVLFDGRDTPMVADFGQARAMGSTGTVTVTRAYRFLLPPETITSGVATVQSDVYQAGVLMYRVVNGDAFYNVQRPTTAAALEAQIKRGRFPDRRRFFPHVPKRLRTVIRKAMRLDATDRYQAASEFADALARVPVPLNWECRPKPAPGGFIWTTTRQGQPDWRVELLPDTPGWRVQVFTVASAARAKGVGPYWRRKLSLDDADRHLTGVFENLA